MLLSTLFIISNLVTISVTASLSLIPDHQLSQSSSSITNHKPVFKNETWELSPPQNSTFKSKWRTNRRKIKLASEVASGVLTLGGIIFANRKRIKSFFGTNTSIKDVPNDPGKMVPVYESWLFAFIIFLVLFVLICTVTFFWPKDAGDEELPFIDTSFSNSNKSGKLKSRSKVPKNLETLKTFTSFIPFTSKNKEQQRTPLEI